MKEASFGGGFARELVEAYGGRVHKISDRSSLGLPDNMYYKTSIVTFYETKIYHLQPQKTESGLWRIEPWAAVNDLRQYEVCRQMSTHATVAYVIYCPTIRMTAVIDLKFFEMFRKSEKNPVPIKYLSEGDNFESGNGVESLIRLINRQREQTFTVLTRNYAERLPHEIRPLRLISPDNGHS